jgi:holo-[acyl-carrier protein] synthase
MILGLGTDLVAISRLESILARHRDRFLERVFTPTERAECLDRARPASHLAARLAAKEAAMKALGTGWGQGVHWKNIEVHSTGRHPPRLTLHGAARQQADRQGVRQTLLSLSHDGDYAIAVVIATD